MKKYFYLAAVSAMMLTACSSENDVVQPTTAQPTNPVAVQQQAVAFDTYLSGTTASTRAGDPTGVMTTDKLRTPSKGFGVFAYTHTGAYPGNIAPNFMFNEHVHWTSGWTYSPLKYWPNETTKDSQTPNATAPALDKVSFFAYAPYIAPDADGTMITTQPGTTTDARVFSTPETAGIISISRNTVTGDPLVEWAYSGDLDKNVDLLWGVAPNGMTYQSVNPDEYVNKAFGYPLKDMIKPDKDQKMKFLFQHALSRIGFSVVSAIDQIAAGDDGGKFTSDPTTKVLIKNVQVWGDFGTRGVLNLNNTSENVAKWISTSFIKTDDADVTPLFWFDNGTAIGASAPLNVANGYIASDLRYVASQITAAQGDAAAFASINDGVLPSEQPLLAQGADPSKKVESATPAFEVGRVYYVLSGKDYVVASASATNAEDAYTLSGTYDAAGSSFNKVFTTSAGSKASLNGYTPQYYSLTWSTAKNANNVGEGIADNQVYYTEAGGIYTWNKNTTGAELTGDITYYTLDAKANLAVDAYTSATYYNGLVPRYFMVIPTADTPIKIKITYAVVTKDEKLSNKMSEVENDITKTVSVNLQSGKSYNLKLILGLTSVKLDATVADWQVADDSEIWLPKNVD